MTNYVTEHRNGLHNRKTLNDAFMFNQLISYSTEQV